MVEFVVPRGVLEVSGIAVTLVGAVADIHEMKKPAIVLTLAGTLLLFMSLWSQGESLMVKGLRGK